MDSTGGQAAAEGQLDEDAAPPAGNPPPKKPAPPNHTVVFVHGMGSALKGGTLREWAEPLMQSLHDIALVHQTDSVSEQSALIIDSASGSDDTQASTRIRVSKAGAQGGYLKILLTEARWVDDFTPATAMATYWWSLSMALYVWRRVLGLLWWNLSPATRGRWILMWPMVVIIMVLSATVIFLGMVAFLSVLGLLVLLAWVPVIGKWGGRLVALFSEFLGDPSVWVRSPLQAAAMRERVIATLTRAEVENSNVTIVAHSQGAAIAGQVLFTPGFSTRGFSVTNFVTVGCGLPLLGYARFGGTATGKQADPVADWALLDPPLRWVNIWGKFDFVPAGPMGSKEGRKRTLKKIFGGSSRAGRGPEEHAVFNRSALITDHIVYSQNRIEVIDPIARLVYDNGPPLDLNDPPLDREGKPVLWLRPVGEPGDPSEVKRLRLHRLMVKCLGMTRLLAIFGGITLAQPLLAWLQPQPWTLFLARCSSQAGSAWWPCSSQSAEWPRWNGIWPISNDLVILVLASLAITGVMLAVLNRWVWNALHARVERRFDMQGGKHHGGWSLLLTYLAAVLLMTVALPLYAGLQAGEIPQPAVVAYILFALGLLLMSLGNSQIAGLPARYSDTDNTSGGAATPSSAASTVPEPAQGQAVSG